jgi:hypothetical protein
MSNRLLRPSENGIYGAAARCRECSKGPTLRNIKRSTTRPNRFTILLAWTMVLPVVVAAGCSTLGDRGKQLVPTSHSFRTGPFLFSSDFELTEESPVVQSLQSLERETSRALEFEMASSDPTIEVYILNDRESFSHFLKFYYPELPSRRAFFLAQGESRVVYTYKGPRLEEDLRHEATHALLNLRFGDLPLWLDEGLAEYFEVSSPAEAGSHEHLDKLPADLAGRWKPDLSRLEALNDIRQMTPEDYREAWAWVYSLLNQSGPGKATLLAYLREPPTSREESRLSARLSSNGMRPTGDALVTYMGDLRNRRVSQGPTTKPRVIRFQDRLQDSTVVESRSPGVREKEERSFLRRLGSSIRRLGSAVGL